jgi:site-specific recombinase XerD
LGVTEYLQKEELDKLIHSITNPRDRLLVRLLYESGCSVSEISELKTSAVHPDGTIHFIDRTAFISTELAQELLKQADQYIFHTRQTPTITPKRIQQILKPYIASIHKGKTTPHILRYTHIVHAYKQGLQLQVISEQTGLTPIRLAQILGDMPSQKGYGAFFRRGGKL